MNNIAARFQYALLLAVYLTKVVILSAAPAGGADLPRAYAVKALSLIHISEPTRPY